MKLHTTTVEKFLRIYENFGGHRDEARLRSALNEVELDVYQRESGEKILVLSDHLEREKSHVKGLPR